MGIVAGTERFVAIAQTVVSVPGNSRDELALVLTDRRLFAVRVKKKPSAAFLLAMPLKLIPAGVWDRLCSEVFPLDLRRETPESLASRGDIRAIPYSAIEEVGMKRRGRLAGGAVIVLRFRAQDGKSRKVTFLVNPFPDLFEAGPPGAEWSANPAVTAAHLQDMLRRRLPTTLAAAGRWRA